MTMNEEKAELLQQTKLTYYAVTAKKLCLKDLKSSAMVR